MTALGSAPASRAPAPRADAESEPFWAALRAHHLALQRCPACGRLRFPPMPGCPYCGSGLPAARVEVSGHGRVYSFVRVHRALTAAMTGETPYVVSVIELDEGPRMVGRIGEGADAIRIGDAATPVFVDHERWTELRWDVARPEPSASPAPP